jgi:hypothetical protein
MLQILIIANVVPSSLLLPTLMMEATRSSETPVLTRAAWCNIPEDGIVHSHRRENLKSYKNKQTKQTPWPLVRERTKSYNII